MFEILSYKKRFDANKVHLSQTGHPYIVRTALNNGMKGYLNEDKKYLNDGNTISFGQDTATMFYQEKPYFTGDKIKILKPKNKRFNKLNSMFFITEMTKAFSNFSWGSSSFSIDVISGQIISLPITAEGEIDFDFMESFIRELAAYLKVSGLDNYELSKCESDALAHFNELKWKEFKVTDIFSVKNTHNILSNEIVKDSGNIPYLCASAENNSVSSYISFNADYLDEGNCIFIGGKTFVVSYQESDFFSNDSHNLALYLKQNDLRTEKNQLYLAACVRKGLQHLYSWGDSISNKKIQKDVFMLPVKDGVPDYDAMETFISAVQKLVIKDVVLYADRKIAVAKQAAENGARQD